MKADICQTCLHETPASMYQGMNAMKMQKSHEDGTNSTQVKKVTSNPFKFCIFLDNQGK